MNRAREQAGGQRGFSLLEVIVVVTIILVMVALAGKSMFSAVANYRLSSSARSIAAAAQLARIKATGRDTRYRLVIDATNRQYRIERLNRTTNAWEVDPGAESWQALAPNVNFVTTAVTAPAGQSAGPDTEMDFNNRGILVNSGTPVNSRCFYLTATNVPRGWGVCATMTGKVTTYRAGTGSGWQVQ